MIYTFQDDGIGGFVVLRDGDEIATISQDEVSTYRNIEKGYVEVSDGEHFFISVYVENISGAVDLDDVEDAIDAARSNDSDGGGGSGPDSNAIYRDGSQPPTADTPWNSKKITGLADGVSANDAVNKGQLDIAIAGITAYKVSSGSFVVNDYTLDELTDLTPDIDFLVFSDNGSGTLLKENVDYTFAGSTITIPSGPDNIRIIIL